MDLKLVHATPLIDNASHTKPSFQNIYKFLGVSVDQTVAQVELPQIPYHVDEIADCRADRCYTKTQEDSTAPAYPLQRAGR